MKKTFTLIVALCSFIMISQGQVIYDETFNYSVANLAQEPTWTTLGTPPGIGTGRNIVTPALTYITSAGTYALSDLGKTINCDYTSGAADYYSFKLFTATPVTSTVYLSFLYKAGVTQKQTQSEVFGLGDSASTGPKVWAGKGVVTTTSFRLGTTRISGTGADIKWGTTEFADTNVVILVVLKYDFSTATASLFINPTLGSVTEPTPDAIENTASTGRTKLSALRFRVNGNNRANFNVGCARVSGSWAAAVAKTGNVGLEGQIQGKSSFTISPNPVYNKMTLDYNLAENAGVSLVLYNTSGQAVETLINNDFHPAGTYSQSFDATGLKNGIYLARFTTGNTSKSTKIIISR